MAVMYASVSVVDTTYNLTLCHTATDTLGRFTIELEDVDLTNATINVGHISYAVHTAQFVRQNQPLTIILKDRAVSADDVTVTAKKAAYTFEQGKINVDVTQIKNFERLNADKLLARIPGVSGSGASFTLYGTPATIYINGVKQTLSADALEAYLSSLPASALTNIELNAIPSGKYGKDVGAVIDIELDRKMPDGIVAQVEVKGGMVETDLGDLGANAFFMMKRQNVTFNTVLSYENEDVWAQSRDSTFYGTPETYILDTRKTDGRKDVITSTSNLMLDLGKGHLLDFNAFIYYDKGRHTTAWQDKISHINDINTPWGYNKSESRTNDDMYSATIKYSSPTKGKKHYVSAYYSGMYGGRRSDRDYFNLSGNDYGGYMSSDVGMVGHTHTFAVDATSKINDKFSFDYGVQGDINVLNDKANYYDYTSNSALSSSNYDANEGLFATYLKFNYNITKRMGFSADVRYDYTNHTYDNHDGKGRQTSSYSNFTPTIKYWFSVPNYRLSISAESSINRPHFSNLLPGKRYVNDYFYQIGNPDLKASNDYLFMMQNRFWGFLNLSLRYFRSNNNIQQVFLEDSQNMSYSTYLNASNKSVASIYLHAPFELFDGKLYGDVSGQVFFTKYDNINPLLEINNDKVNISAQIYADIYYDITDRLSIELGSEILLKSYNLQYTVEPRWRMKAAASYSFMPKKQLILAVEGQNLFSSFDTSAFIEYSQNTMQLNRYAAGPIVSLSLKYKFNKGSKVDYRDNTSDFSRMK